MRDKIGLYTMYTGAFVVCAATGLAALFNRFDIFGFSLVILIGIVLVIIGIIVAD